MHRLCTGYAGVPVFSSKVVAYAIKRCFSLIYSPHFFMYRCRAISVILSHWSFFLCIGYAQVMQGSRFFFKCDCLCDKTLFFSYLLAPFFLCTGAAL